MVTTTLASRFHHLSFDPALVLSFSSVPQRKGKREWDGMGKQDMVHEEYSSACLAEGVTESEVREQGGLWFLQQEPPFPGRRRCSHFSFCAGASRTLSMVGPQVRLGGKRHPSGRGDPQSKPRVLLSKRLCHRQPWLWSSLNLDPLDPSLLNDPSTTPQ